MDAAFDEPRHWGCFTLGGAAYALPLSQLREAVPSGRLTVWPGTSACVVGAIELRGLLLPVVDLRRLAGDGSTGPAGPAGATGHAPLVIVIAHDGHLLGLCADAVTGIFQARSDGVQAVSHADGSQPCVLGALARPADGTLHSVLHAPALMSLPQVPRCRDPRTGREDQARTDAPAIDAGSVDAHWLLMQAGPWRLAIHSSCVRMAVPLAGLRPSVLSRMRGNEDCLGEWPHPTQPIAVIDPLVRSGLGRLSEGEARQALLIDTEGGLLGLAIDHVLDVRHLPAEALQALPGGRLTQPEWFAGVLRLPEEGDDPASDPASDPAQALSPLLALDASRWTGHADLSGLASLHAPQTSCASAIAGDATALTLITYALPAEAGTPIDQIDEVLPWQADRAGLEDDGLSPWMGLCLHRQQAVALLCLQRWSGATTTTPPDASTGILLVRSGDQRVGFIVPKLLGIEQAGWQSAVSGVLRSRNPTPIQAARLAQIDAPNGARRLVPVLDLRELAGRALAGRAIATSP